MFNNKNDQSFQNNVYSQKDSGFKIMSQQRDSEQQNSVNRFGQVTLKQEQNNS